MDREAYIRSLGPGSWQPGAIEAFFRGLHRRVPAGDTDPVVVEARDRIALWVAELNAIMLGRALDQRVPRDIVTLADAVADRMARYRSEDWSSEVEGATVLDHARRAMGEVAADLRLVAPDWDDDDAGAADGDAGDGDVGDPG